MKKEFPDKSSTNDSKGRVIKMIPSYAVDLDRYDQHSLHEINKNLQSLIARLDAKSIDQKLISVPSQKGIEFLREEDIISCQAKGSYTEIRLESGTILTDSKGLRFYNRLLNPSCFLRTNRAWIVNLRKVIRYHNTTNELETRNGLIIPVSRDLVAEVKQRIVRGFQA